MHFTIGGSVNAALLSRSKVFVLHGLTVEEIAGILRRALAVRKEGRICDVANRERR